MICSCATQAPCVIYTNASFEKLTGYSAAEMLGQSYDSYLSAPAGSPGSARELLEEALRAGQPARGALRFVHRNGKELQVELEAAPARDALGKIGCYVMALRDLTHVERHVEHLRFVANHDSLTGLPNRRLLLDRIEQALGRYRRTGEVFTLAFLDLNELKYVNDKFGHTTGDELLKHVAHCLTAGARSCDTLARYGGDEFVMLLAAANDPETARRAVDRALQALDLGLTIGETIFKPTCSIGIAMCPRDGTDATTLLRAADEAMYLAKSTDRSTSLVHGF